MNAATNPEIWVVLDKDSYPVFTAGWKEACHEHINDAVLHDKSARKWVVRQVAVQPTKTESVLIQGVAYTLPIEVDCELLRLHIDLKTAQKDAERYQFWRKQYRALGMMDCAQCAGIDLSNTCMDSPEKVDLVTDAAIKKEGKVA